jgi:hypothetical protein
MADIISLIQNHADLLTNIFTHLTSQERAHYVTVSHQWHKHLVLATNILEIAPTWDEHFLAGHYHFIVRGKPMSSDTSDKLCAGIICLHDWQLFRIWYSLITIGRHDVRDIYDSLMKYCGVNDAFRFYNVCYKEGRYST